MPIDWNRAKHDIDYAQGCMDAIGERIDDASRAEIDGYTGDLLAYAQHVYTKDRCADEWTDDMGRYAKLRYYIAARAGENYMIRIGALSEKDADHKYLSPEGV